MSEQDVSTSLAPDADATIPRIKLSETGYNGLRITNGIIIEEQNRVFRGYQLNKVVAEMRTNPVVQAAFNVYRMMLSRVNWTVEAPIGATTEQLERAKFVQGCMDDMENSWGSFISDTLTYLEYGFSIQEKVFRRRLRKNGSRYNDGLVGLAKISPRSQDTVYRWNFSDDGRQVDSVEQSLSILQYTDQYEQLANTNRNTILIPREKFMLFTADATKGNPQGTSLLKGVYLAYKRLELMQDQEALNVAKDVSGIPFARLPPQYMAPDATPADAAVFVATQNILNNISEGKQRGIVFPSMFDQTSGQDMFSLSLLERKGIPSTNIDGIIRRYQTDILTALSCDVIRMGNDSTGSFSLASEKSNLLSLALDHRLKEIANVLNLELIPQIFALNGWTDEVLPKFVAGDVNDISLEEFSVFIQRVKAVGMIEVDRAWLNLVRKVAGIPQLPADEPVNVEALNLGASQSKSGQGMASETGGLNGTGNSVSTVDNSVANNSNAA
jgi:hypothetical protein